MALKAKKTTPAILVLVIFFILIFLPVIGVVKADDTICIRDDGSIEGTNHILRDGNIYTLTDDINVNASSFYGIKVETDNIVIDGAGHTIHGAGIGRGIEIANPYNTTIKTGYNVTVTNITIRDFEIGVAVFGYWGNIIDGVILAGNTITRNDVGIRFSSYSSYADNLITGNNITANRIGVYFEMGHYGHEEGNLVVGNWIAHNQVGMQFLWLGDYYSWKPDPFYMNNRIYNNSFITNSQNVVNAHIIYDPDCVNIWDNGISGNYWSNYNGTDANGDKIGDTPYIIDPRNQDNYPRTSPHDIVVISEFPLWVLLPLFVTTTLIIIVCKQRLPKESRI
ncbi:MAG: hypothetical protein CW691_04255 [Candidatus Bathyarchaeum sp.]|nr:MAG: hypothetical protein CW691_04255 [Candidatus Bathyarchaeum sp.]